MGGPQRSRGAGVFFSAVSGFQALVKQNQDSRFSSKTRRPPTLQLVSKSFRDVLLTVPGAAEAIYSLALRESHSSGASSDSLNKALRLLESLSVDQPAVSL